MARVHVSFPLRPVWRGRSCWVLFRYLLAGSFNREPSGFGKSPPGGIQEFGPTVMAAVPKIWDILKKGVEDNVGPLIT